MRDFIIQGYDIMQVCMNGHQITTGAHSHPQHRQPFCSECGAETITQCPECNTDIRGFYHARNVIGAIDPPVPNNCHNCGAAYPWRQTAIAEAIEVLQMDLDEQDAASVPELVKAVSIEAPGTQIAAIKLKRLLPKIGKATYDVAVKVISDLASETAKKTLGL
jgi:hypothetical protein